MKEYMYTVFRVEDNEGRGPWSAYPDIVYDLNIWDHMEDYENYPGARVDGLIWRKDLKCCCHNACSLFHWFGPWIDIILENYKIYAIRVPARTISNSRLQAEYDRTTEIDRVQLFT